MSLIKCNECRKEISDKSDRCIHCGAPIEKIKEKVKSKVIHWIPLLISFIVFFLLIMIYNVMNTDTDSSFFYTLFNSILLISSVVSILLVFYMIPKERKILFPLSIIVGIFVFMSVMGTAFKAFN